MIIAPDAKTIHDIGLLEVAPHTRPVFTEIDQVLLLCSACEIGQEEPCQRGRLFILPSLRKNARSSCTYADTNSTDTHRNTNVDSNVDTNRDPNADSDSLIDSQWHAP